MNNYRMYVQWSVYGDPASVRRPALQGQQADQDGAAPVHTTTTQLTLLHQSS